MAGDEELSMERALVAGPWETAQVGLGQVMEDELELFVIGDEPEASADRDLAGQARPLASSADGALRPASRLGPDRLAGGGAGSPGGASWWLGGSSGPASERAASHGSLGPAGPTSTAARHGTATVAIAGRVTLALAAGGLGLQAFLEGLEFLGELLVALVLPAFHRLVLLENRLIHRLQLTKTLFEQGLAREGRGRGRRRSRVRLRHGRWRRCLGEDERTSLDRDETQEQGNPPVPGPEPPCVHAASPYVL